MSKKFFITISLFISLTLSLAAENWVHPDFEDFGIKSVAVISDYYGFSNAHIPLVKAGRYGSLRAADGTTYNPILDYYSTFTPPLTSPEYPVSDSADEEISPELDREINEWLTNKGYDAEIIDDFTKGNLTELLAHASAGGADAVLLVRYYKLASYTYKEPGSLVFGGEPERGVGISPAIELYDTESGVRLWYSAYHSFHMNDKVVFYLDAYQEFVDTVFARGDNPYKQAVNLIINYTLGSFPKTFYNKVPLPAADDSQDRNRSVVNRSARKQYFSSSEWPTYNKTFGALGFTYSFEYIGSLSLEKKIADYTYIPFQADNVLGHKVTLTPFIFGWGNFGVQPIRVNLRAFTFNDEGTVLNIDGGVSAMLEYHFRLNDFHTVFLGLDVAAVASGISAGDYRGQREGVSIMDGDVFIQPGISAGIVFNKPVRRRWFIFTSPAGMRPLRLFLNIDPIGMNNSPIASIGFGFQLRNNTTGNRLINPHHLNLGEKDME